METDKKITEKKPKKEAVKALAPAQAPQEVKQEAPKAEEAKKEEKKQISKKTEAVVKVSGVPISKKHSMYICAFIKGKSIDQALKELAEVIEFKRAIPFKGEIPHRKGMMSGRYPINACKEFTNILKGLRANAVVNGLAPEKTRVTFGSATWGSRPQRRGGVKAKRTFLVVKATEVDAKEKK